MRSEPDSFDHLAAALRSMMRHKSAMHAAATVRDRGVRTHIRDVMMDNKEVSVATIMRQREEACCTSIRSILAKDKSSLPEVTLANSLIYANRQ